MSLLDAIVVHEAPLRLAVFAGLLLLLWSVEARRTLPALRQWRNLGLVLIGTLCLRGLLPVLAVGLALRLQQQPVGLLSLIDGPLWLEITLAVLILDAAIYAQHRLLHRVPLLWRLHRVHHSDPVLDVSTALRFHPAEIVLSMLIKLALVAAIGASPAAVVIFELLLSAGALLTHAAITLPPWLDRRLRWLLVTPSMHRIHHSRRDDDAQHNFGFHLSVWDRLFGSYRAESLDGAGRLRIGVDGFDHESDPSLIALLLQPLRNPSSR